MFKKLLLAFCSLALLLAPAVIAQEDERPTIAILRFGSHLGVNLTEIGILDSLEIYDLINADERAMLDEYQDLEGEQINVIWGDANFDFPTVTLMIANALDRGADVLLTLSTPVTQTAVNATYNMDSPPTVLFTSVYNPYQSGIADAPCIKPDHVTGSETLTPYAEIVPLLLVQDPDMKKIGTIYNSSETSGHFGAERIAEIGESLGLTVESMAITSLADLPLAAESMVDRGVEAFLIPTDMITAQGLPLLMMIANQNGIPIFHSSVGGIYAGATISAGAGLYYVKGVNIGHILAAHLNGEIDIAKTAISVTSNMAVGVNMDLAVMQDTEISEALVAKADFIIENREIRMPTLAYLEDIVVSDSLRVLDSFIEQRPIELSPDIMSYMEAMEAYDYKAGGAAFLETLVCTPELIAEQQAELDAAGE